MLQINVKNYASDALEDAMRLAQTKALNSYTFSDCMEYLNYAWRDIYDRIAMIDDGYYGKTVRLTKKLTRLPPFVKNSIMIYTGQSPVDSNRVILRSAGTTDLMASGTYRISGMDLFCPDAERRTVWLYYVPICPQLFFTHHNRDPKILDEHAVKRIRDFGVYRLIGIKHDELGQEVEVNIADNITTEKDISDCFKWELRNRASLSGYKEDITDSLIKEQDSDSAGKWDLIYVSCDFPYIFVSYRHNITGEHISGFFTKELEFVEYNPFSFTGRNNNVKYVDCHWNDKTGLGVVIADYNDLDSDDMPRLKELGWTPDTLLTYPAPEMYRYLVARLADKFSALNESNVLGVQKELVEAKFAFEAFLDKDKSSWKRIENVNPPTLTDWL